MKKSYCILLLILPLFVVGQGEIDDEIKIFHTNESTFHLGITTSGWNIGYRYGKRKDGFRKTLWDVDFMTIKHPREVKISYGLYSSVYGKHNCFFSLSLSRGYQKEYFSKLDKGGVAVRFICTYGISIGLLKPVYYYVGYTDQDTGDEVYNLELFDTDNSLGTYYNSAPFKYGLDEISINPGVQCKAGLNFEFSKTDKKVKALEIGVFSLAYSEKIDIMASDDNAWFFLGIFIQYRFGRITGKR